MLPSSKMQFSERNKENMSWMEIISVFGFILLKMVLIYLFLEYNNIIKYFLKLNFFYLDII